MILAVKKTDRTADVIVAVAIVAGLGAAMLFYGLPLIFSIGKLFQ